LIMLFGVYLFILFITLGVSACTMNIKDYQNGIQDIVKEFSTRFKHVLPDQFWDGLEKQVQSFVRDGLPALISSLMAQLQGITWSALLFFIYLFFWVFEPLPISSSVAQVFKSYLLLKTLVCLLFASLMSFILWCLACPLWHLFFIVTFVLNYIPEVGAILSAILTVPAVLFDGSVDVQTRARNVILLAIFGTLVKVITGNVIEVRMYATKGGQFMRMHPVILMAVMMMCSAILGLTGMFLAVPIMAATKYYMIVAEMPVRFLNPLLTVIEGDEAGPHKNFVDAQRAVVSNRALAGVDDTEVGSQLPLIQSA